MVGAGASLEAQLRIVGEQASSLIGLDEKTSEQLLREHERWSQRRAASPAGQLEAFNDLRARVRRLLPHAAYERYSSILTRHFEQWLMQAR